MPQAQQAPPRRARELRVLTNSELKSWRRCKRHHLLTYQLGYRPLKQPEPLQFGSLTHDWLEIWWAFRMAGGLELPEDLQADMIGEALKTIETAGQARGVDAFALARARVMARAYHRRWVAWPCDVVAVELPFEAPLRGPKGQRSRLFLQKGKIDAILRYEGRLLGMEHKSTSEDVAPGAIYWRRLRMDSQIAGYVDGARAAGHQLDGMIYDALVKIDQKPMKATPEALRKYTKEKRDKEGNITEPSRLYANQRELDETVEEYEQRIEAVVAENPDAYFAREEIAILDQDLAAWRSDAWDEAHNIHQSRREQRFPRNVDACYLYRRECEFLAVCGGRGDLDDITKFRKLENVHPELQPNTEEV